MASPYAASQGETVTAAFWERLGVDGMQMQQCSSCAHVRFPPNSMCPECHGMDYAWLPIEGAGILWSYTTVRVAPSPQLQSEVPYRLAVAELAEGPMVLGRLVGIAADQDVVIGMPLVLVVDQPEPGEASGRYHFEPA